MIYKLLYYVLTFVQCNIIMCKVVNYTNEFVEVRRSSVFVDKTLLLKKIFKYDHVLLTAPQQFGKTINIQMIKLFLGNKYKKIEVAEFFRNTNIWNDKVFKLKHFCNYPIIYCNLKPKTSVNSVEDVIKEIKISLRDAFLEHNYLLDVTSIEHNIKMQYLNYCHMNETEYEVGLKFLSELLFNHYGKKVVLLLDDYDFFITYSIFKKDLDSTKIAQILFRIMDNIINLNDFLERSVVMGRLPIKLGVQFSGLYLLEHFKFMETRDFTPYFGFTKRETEDLLDKFGLGRYKSKVSDWYGGYSYLHGNFNIYNPWSVLMFIKTKQLFIQWVSINTRKTFYNYIEPHYELKEDITKLITNGSVTIHAISSFTTYEIDKLKNVQFASYSYAEDKSEDHLFLQVLLESGYLTYAEKYRVLPILTKLKFPNKEVAKSFEQVLIRLNAIYNDIDRYEL